MLEFDDGDVELEPEDAAEDAEIARDHEGGRYVLAVYRRPRVVARRFEAVGRPEAVRADAERALAWYAARRVTIRTAGGHYLPPVLKPAPAYDWADLLNPVPFARQGPATVTTGAGPAFPPPGKPPAR